jgi:hypothetical protein
MVGPGWMVGSGLFTCTGAGMRILRFWRLETRYLMYTCNFFPYYCLHSHHFTMHNESTIQVSSQCILDRRRHHNCVVKGGQELLANLAVRPNKREDAQRSCLGIIRGLSVSSTRGDSHACVLHSRVIDPVP